MSLLHRTAIGAVAGCLTVGAAAASAASTTSLKASLTGSTERPQRGDADGRGSATVRIKGTQLCYALSLSKIDRTLAGHIHRGKAGKAGGVVVPLYEGAEDKQGCVKVKSALAKEIAKSPSGFYVNVHNAKFPGGALRGQLSKR